MSPILRYVTLSASALFVTTAAAVAGPCLERGDLARHLASRFGETSVAAGLAGDGRVIEIYVSERTGTWTIVAVLPTGLACAIAAGEGWWTRSRPAPVDPPV